MMTDGGIRKAVRSLGLEGRPVCLHSSLRSFGRLKGGPAALVDGFLDEGCTVIVPTFTYYHVIPPPPGRRIPRNALHYDGARPGTGSSRVYRTTDRDVVESMGIVPVEVARRRDRIRSVHPVYSFAAVGPLAEELLSGQTYIDVYQPLRRTAELGGSVVLAGVGLNRMTAILLAGQMAGRELFRRWALAPDGQTVEVAIGSCSEGFERLAPALQPVERTIKVGESHWRVFPMAETLQLAAEAIRTDPGITHCGDPDCERCRDAVAGGPILD